MLSLLLAFLTFIAKNNAWEKEKNLENAKKLVDEFKERIEAEVI